MKRYFISMMLYCTIAFAQDMPKTPAEYQQMMKDGRMSLMIVNSIPSGATVTVDGKTMTPAPGAAAKDKTPIVVNLFKKDAPRKVQISLAGYKPVERIVDVNGSPVAIEVTLEPEGNSTAAKPAPAVVPVAAAEGTRTGPFGFHKGMTRAQVIEILGKGAIKTGLSHDDLLVFSTAPKPNPEFETYGLFFSEKDGLLKVVVLGKNVSTGDSGFELRNAFSELTSSLSQKYGPPTNPFDFCTGDDTQCNTPEFWMLSLKQKNRTLSSLWDLATPVSGITGISLQVTALNLNAGYLQLAYEFEGWGAYLKEENKKKNSSL